MSELKDFISLTEAMREAQRMYFKHSAKARKTRATSDWDVAKNWLDKSKQLEAEVDAKIEDFRNPQKKLL